eukprot:TRINITY_DN3_c0_g1_i1.p1 TRINITY_DN3_c0_g1~~TRINITY_DN3_c0_g1_i1.p1  ORF type:complete len:169 (+),score=19.51 TRINITY_DN3_c0_g1_i1:67-573(+)
MDQINDLDDIYEIQKILNGFSDMKILKREQFKVLKDMKSLCVNTKREINILISFQNQRDEINQSSNLVKYKKMKNEINSCLKKIKNLVWEYKNNKKISKSQQRSNSIGEDADNVFSKIISSLISANNRMYNVQKEINESFNGLNKKLDLIEEEMDILENRVIHIQHKN